MLKHTFSLSIAGILFISMLIGALANNHASAQSDTNSQPATRICIPDSSEPNDSAGAATPVTGGLYTPLSVCAGDNDYFSIALQAGQQLSVDLLFTHAAGDVELRILNPVGIQIATGSSTSDNESTTVRAEISGIYTIRVLGWTSTVENTYEMNVAVSCEQCISYQGQLQAGGSNANGSYEFMFSLYDEGADGNQLGDVVTQVLPVVDGLFSAELYFGDPTDRAGIDVQFLDIRVRPAGSAAALTPLTPRTELLAAPIALTLVAGATISGTSTALNLYSSGADGLEVLFANDDGIYVQNANDEGIYIRDAGETGLWVDDAGKAAVVGQNTSTSFPAGIFVNTNQITSLTNHSGGVGIYGRGKAGTSVANPDAPDLILGATSADAANRTSDDGRISSDPAYSSSDLEMASMDKAWVLLDDDNNSTGAYFGIYNHSSELSDRVFYVQDDGDVFGKSYNTITRSSGRDGAPIVQYGATSMQQRIEDFGTATLADGTATVMLNANFMAVADTTADYQVFLTPRGDCPLYLAATDAGSFSVQAMGGESCSIAFDYRVVASPIDSVEITPEELLGEDLDLPEAQRDSAEEVTP